MKTKKICCMCERKIVPKERYVLLGTYEDKKEKIMKIVTETFEEKYYHIYCWREYMKKMVDDQIEAVRKNLMRSAGVMAGNLMKAVRSREQ